MSRRMSVDRRDFLRGAAWMGVAAFAGGCQLNRLGFGEGGSMQNFVYSKLANKRIRVGFVGIGSRGTGWWSGCYVAYHGSGALAGFMAPYLGLDTNATLGGWRYPFKPNYKNNRKCPFACPERQLTDPLMGLKGTESSVYFLGINASHERQSINQIKIPSRHMAIAEAYQTTQLSWRKVDKMAFVHPGQVGNVLFVGGNVNALERGRVPQDADSSFWLTFGDRWSNNW